MHKPIYPEIKIEYLPEMEIVSDETKEIKGRLKSSFSMESFLRIQHGSKWYLMRFYVERVWTPKRTQVFDIENSLAIFRREIWFNHKLGIIDPDKVDKGGNKFYLLDPDQRSEEDRLIKTYGLNVTNNSSKSETPKKEEDAKV